MKHEFEIEPIRMRRARTNSSWYCGIWAVGAC